MMSDREKELAELRTRVSQKVEHIFNFVWLIIAAFVLVGSFTPMRETAAIAMIILTICWMMNQIIDRGIAATKALFFTKKSDSDNNKEQ